MWKLAILDDLIQRFIFFGRFSYFDLKHIIRLDMLKLCDVLVRNRKFKLHFTIHPISLIFCKNNDAKKRNIYRFRVSTSKKHKISKVFFFKIIHKTKALFKNCVFITSHNIKCLWTYLTESASFCLLHSSSLRIGWNLEIAPNHFWYRTINKHI